MLLYATLTLWIISALFILFERRNVRIIIYSGVFGLIASIAFLLLGSPDVAMAEAAISVFTTIFFVVCLEKYYSFEADLHEKQTEALKVNYFTRYGLPLVFTVFLAGLFIYFIPDNVVNPYLKELYLSRFAQDVGGFNPVTAIYLSYRVYDTLFEALILVIAVVAAIHMSKFSDDYVKDGKHSEIEGDSLANLAIRMISPVILLFGVFIIFNGHISAGGGFQGGLIIAAFFVARYMIYDVYDIPIAKVTRAEELVFVAIALLAAAIVFQGMFDITASTLYQNIYLLVMNTLIGLKVACGFILLFYRFIAIERNDIDRSDIGKSDF